jgi:sialic acid synthase SpsE
VVGPREMQRRSEYRRSIVALRRLRAGEILDGSMIDFRRPGTGIGPEHAPLILGRRLIRDVGADDLLDFDMFGPASA